DESREIKEVDDEDIMKIKKATNQIFVDIIKEGIKDGSIRKDLDPVKTSLILWGETLGVLQLVTLKGNIICNEMDCTTEDLIEYFFEFTYKALKA
ncbi:MAG: hypothetical protein KDC90_19630, partial [Ignavibacteriae bacterium]|nr:hypothetical protein [Ignavibacteriota bacterium]